ncbi:MAG: hypothetical protein Q4B82_09145 [Alysiella sp.]|uniref:hypothetical protein n=1 Tax=Alysiella sp. TaxID=1872483 RepID=UPI0026DD85F9|nr:hypothetical protein [Alysiella sp.]MDO4434726.1 hypothetical protein [Alysiella sp.]
MKYFYPLVLTLALAACGQESSSPQTTPATQASQAVETASATSVSHTASVASCQNNLDFGKNTLAIVAKASSILYATGPNLSKNWHLTTAPADCGSLEQIETEFAYLTLHITPNGNVREAVIKMKQAKVNEVELLQSIITIMAVSNYPPEQAMAMAAELTDLVQAANPSGNRPRKVLHGVLFITYIENNVLNIKAMPTNL